MSKRPDWNEYVRLHLSLPELTREREEQIREDLALQLEQAYDDALARGLSEADAEAAARAHVPDWESFISDVYRSERRHAKPRLDRWADRTHDRSPRGNVVSRWLNDLGQDSAYALRTLRKSPGFTAVAVLTLALGIGANTAMFSMVNGVLIRPLPYPNPEQLVQITTMWKDYGEGDISEPEYFDLLDRSRSFESLGMHDSPRMEGRGVTLTGGPDGPERIAAVRITPGAFQVLGARPLLGRLFEPDEGTPAGEHVVLLSYGLWQRRFGGEADVVGRTLDLGELSHRVAGVMPRDFAYPSRETEIWIPYRVDRLNHNDRGSHYNFIIGRLKDGVTEDQARAELESISLNLRAELGGSYRENDFRFRVRAYADVVTGTVRPGLWLLLGAVGFVLLIACANVANLLLARLTGRERELALRAALGAGRGRIVRQLLTESLLLSILGGAGALVLAALAIATLQFLHPGRLPRLDEIRIDTTVLAFNALLVLATGAGFGLVPARRVFRLDLQSGMKHGGRVHGGERSDRIRSLLVVTELALASVLLVGAALLLQSLHRILMVDPGFRTDDILTTRISLEAARYPQREQRADFYRNLMDELQAAPGVVAAGGISSLPLSGFVQDRSIRPVGSGAVSDAPLQTQYRLVTPDYFETLDIPVLQGRVFTGADQLGSEEVTILSESVARRFWGNANPIGRRITLDGPDRLTVVGIVGDVRQAGITRVEPPIFYRSVYQVPWSRLSLVVRTRTDAASSLRLVRTAVSNLDPLQPVYEVKPMAQLAADSSARERFNALLLTVFASLALGLAVVGVYSVISYSVSQRTHEIGIRMALGAQRRHVYEIVLGQGLQQAVVGIGLGLAGALALARTLESLLYQVSSSDPWSYAFVAFTLAGATLLACYVPARRATKVDPMVALRYE